VGHGNNGRFPALLEARNLIDETSCMVFTGVGKIYTVGCLKEIKKHNLLLFKANKILAWGVLSSGHAGTGRLIANL
jgi:hypothetical protein